MTQRTMSASLPAYTRSTTNVALVESFTGLTVATAPRYEASPDYHAIHRAGLPNKEITRPRPRKYLAQIAAETYFAQILRRDRKCDIKRAVEHYKQDLETSRVHQKTHTECSEYVSVDRLFLRGRSKGLRHWVNLAIENIVVPELQRRAAEEKKIWRAEQRWLNETRQTHQYQAAYHRRVSSIAAQEAEKFRIFGDIGTGVRTAGKEVSEVGKQGARAAQARAKRVSDELLGRDDDMVFECKRLAKVCLDRMQARWTILLDHCRVQIRLVQERALAFRRAQGGVSRDAVSRARIMEALMMHELERMELALCQLLDFFSRSVMEKTREYPPISSFFQVFEPLTGSALRAAREVSCSNGILYDNSFLKQNKLDLYAADFYDAMRDHLTMLMVEANLQSFTWKEERQRLSRVRTR